MKTAREKSGVRLGWGDGLHFDPLGSLIGHCRKFFF